jgi:imidazolonepropionase-like amidohydrolase
MRPRPGLLLFVFLCTLLAPGIARTTRADELVITHVTVINPSTGITKPDMTIVIRNGEIVSVRAAKNFKASAEALVVDGTGKFAIPGLWDMHTHFRDAERDLKMYIANGVLGIRNMGGAAAEVFPLRAAIGNGNKLGPKIVASGPILDGPDTFSNPKFTISAKTVDEAREAVRSLKKEGADFIKVYDQLSKEQYDAIVDEAKKQGIPFAGHIPSAISVREASNAGQRSVEHVVPIAGGSTGEAAYIRQRVDRSAFAEALSTKNFSLIPAKIARDETEMMDHFSRERADETYKLLAKNNTFVTPTLVTQQSLTFIDDLNKKEDSRMVYVSAEELKWWKPENGMLTKYRTPEYIAMRRREYSMMMEELPRARALGVRFLAGTDVTIPYTYPGFSLHDELKSFVAAGLTPMQALETATVNPAIFLGLSKTWGKIESGYAADIVLLRADPLSDITNTQHIDAVVLNGKLLNRSQLDRMLEEAKVSIERAK